MRADRGLSRPVNGVPLRPNVAPYCGRWTKFISTISDGVNLPRHFRIASASDSTVTNRTPLLQNVAQGAGVNPRLQEFLSEPGPAHRFR